MGYRVDTSEIKDIAIEMSAITELHEQERHRAIRDNRQLKDRRRSLDYMRERVINLTFQLSKAVKALERQGKGR